MAYSKEELMGKSRKEIQALAKEFGMKGNASSESIINGILKIQEDELSVKTVIPTAVTYDVMVTPVPEERTIEVAQPEIAIVTETVREFAVNDIVEVLQNGIWIAATVKRVNKKSIRVTLQEDKSEITFKNEEVRFPSFSSTNETLEVMQVEEPNTGAVNADVVSSDQCSNEVLVSGVNISPAVQVSMLAPEVLEDVEKCDEASHCEELANFDPKEEWAAGMENCLQELSTKISSKEVTVVEPVVDATVPFSSEIELAALSTSPFSVTKSAPVIKSDRKRKSIEIGASLANVESLLTSVVPQNVKLNDKQSTGKLISSGNGIKSRPKVTVNSNNKIVGKSLGPDFSKMHAANFSNQKSIVSMVHRKESVVLNMEKAMASAQQGTFQFNAQRAATPSREIAQKNLIKAHAPTSQGVSGSTSSVQFKARSMPNFKAIHEKKNKENEKSSIPTKENSSFASNKHPVGVMKSELLNKATERKVNYVEKHKLDKKAEFLAARRSMTPGKPLQGIRAGTAKSPLAPNNPFHYVN